jgi:hypothetical protein
MDEGRVAIGWSAECLARGAHAHVEDYVRHYPVPRNEGRNAIYPLTIPPYRHPITESHRTIVTCVHDRQNSASRAAPGQENKPPSGA